MDNLEFTLIIKLLVIQERRKTYYFNLKFFRIFVVRSIINFNIIQNQETIPEINPQDSHSIYMFQLRLVFIYLPYGLEASTCFSIRHHRRTKHG